MTTAEKASTTGGPPTRRAIELTQTRGEECRIGKNQILMTTVVVSDGTYSWVLYRTAQDEWWEGCGNCEGDSGFKPWYGGVYGGVCFQCGGVGARRLAGGEAGMLRLIRQRVSSRRSTLNAVQRRVERQREAAVAWAAANVNLASDLACVRVSEELGANVLARLALASVERPLSVRQRDYAISLLVSRAWEHARHVERPTLISVHAGSVGERLTLSGVISVWHYNVSERYDRSNTVTIIVDARNEHGEQVLAKMTTAARWAMDARQGDAVTVTGTVRDHLDGPYGKQTALKSPRLGVNHLVEPPAAPGSQPRS